MPLQPHRHTARRLSTLVQPALSSGSVRHVSRSLTRIPPQLSITCQIPWPLRSSSRWTSTSSTDPLASSEDSSPPTKIRILNLTGHQDRAIKRSFPKGKPENLVQGLERLTAQATVGDKETDKRRKRQDAWHLGASGDAILRFLAIQNPECVNSLKYEIGSISKELGHHPHFMLRYQRNQEACIFVIMCTTHVPYGLSLNDVKLADQIDEAIQRITRTATRTASNKKPITVAPPNSGAIKARLTRALSIEARIYRRDAAAAEIIVKGGQQSLVDDTALDSQFKITPEKRAFLAEIKREQGVANRITKQKIQELTKTKTTTAIASDGQEQQSPSSPSTTSVVEDNNNKQHPMMINAPPQTTSSPRPPPSPPSPPLRLHYYKYDKPRIRFIEGSFKTPPSRS